MESGGDLQGTIVEGCAERERKVEAHLREGIGRACPKLTVRHLAQVALESGPSRAADHKGWHTQLGWIGLPHILRGQRLLLRMRVSSRVPLLPAQWASPGDMPNPYIASLTV